MSLITLPREILYLIFEYLHKEHITYSFVELNNYFSLIVKYFIGKRFDLTKVKNDIIFQYNLSTGLPLIGFNLRELSIGYPYCLSTYIKAIKTYCPNLDVLNIYCYSQKEDIRCYVAYLIHNQVRSLTFIYNGKIVGEQISLRLVEKCSNEQFENIPIASFLILNLSSMNDLVLLKRYSQSDFVFDGLYMIECISSGEWLTDSKDDLCIMSKKVHREGIFSIKRTDNNQSYLEYELHNEQTQHRLTVLTDYEDEERWISSSILSTHRKESSRSCSAFIFEKVDDENQFHIRPCYSRAKRLQVSGKRVIVSLCDNESTLNHRFRLHRVS